MLWLRAITVLFVFLAAFGRPASASAFAAGAPASSEARVGAFELVAVSLVGASAETSPRLHEGIGTAYDENASGYRFAARGAPRIGRSLSAAGDITVNSAIKNSPFAVRQAKALGQAAQRDVDSLISALRAGNTNPGIGTRNLGGGFFELRGANAGRVIVHQGSANQFTIVGKFQGHVRGGTANSAIIQRLISESGL